MDGWKVRPSRTVIPQKPDQLIDTRRPDQLGLSEERNVVPLVCGSRTREISSGCKSSTASPFIQIVPRRSPSPIISSKTSGQELKLLRRSQSADRRRPSNPSSVCSRPLTPSPKSLRPSTPACDSVTQMHSSTRLLAGRTPDGVWPSMKSLSLSSGMNSSKTAVSERQWTAPLNRTTSQLSENARPADDLHGRTVDRARWLGLIIRVSANSSKSNSLITPSRGLIHGRIHDSHVSDKGYKQLRVTNESCSSLSSPHLCSSEKALLVRKPSRKSSSPISRFQHTLLLNKTLSAPNPTLKEISSPFSAFNGRKSVVCSTPSVLNCTVQVRKGKQSTKRIEDAHELRMLYNRYLQLRFVNARAEDVLSAQRIRAETTLYDMENVSSDLCDLLVQKRIYMQHMKQDMEMNMLLKEQVDIKAMKNAINSAVDAMQAVGSSICYLSSKVHRVNSLISDLLASARKERLLLDDCAELLAFVGDLLVQDSSLRGHIMQLGQVLAFEINNCNKKEKITIHQ